MLSCCTATHICPQQLLSFPVPAPSQALPLTAPAGSSHSVVHAQGASRCWTFTLLQPGVMTKCPLMFQLRPARLVSKSQPARTVAEPVQPQGGAAQLLSASSSPLSPAPPLFAIAQEGGVGLRHGSFQLPRELWAGRAPAPCLQSAQGALLLQRPPARGLNPMGTAQIGHSSPAKHRCLLQPLKRPSHPICGPRMRFPGQTAALLAQTTQKGWLGAAQSRAR